MRRILALLLAFTMAFALCGCGKHEEVAPTEEPSAEAAPVWSLRQTVDDFGDVTANSKTLITAQIAGTYTDGVSTASHDLEGTVFFQRTYGQHYAMGIGLRENGDIKPTILDNDEKKLLVKIGDKTYEFPLQAPNGTLYAGLDDYSYDGDWLINHLCDNTDLRCVIYIGKSKYSFDMESGNLSQLMDSEGIPRGLAEMSLEEALEVCLTDANWTGNKVGFKKAYNYFYKHIDDFNLMTSEELAKEIQGGFLETEFSQTTGGGYWVVRKYEGSNQQQLHWWADHSERLKADDIYRDRSEAAAPFSIEDDFLSRYTAGKTQIVVEKAQVRKIADGIYLRYIKDVEGEYRAPCYIMFSYDGPYKSQSELEEMVNNIMRNDIPRVENRN